MITFPDLVASDGVALIDRSGDGVLRVSDVVPVDIEACADDENSRIEIDEIVFSSADMYEGLATDVGLFSDGQLMVFCSLGQSVRVGSEVDTITVENIEVEFDIDPSEFTPMDVETTETGTDTLDDGFDATIH